MLFLKLILNHHKRWLDLVKQQVHQYGIIHFISFIILLISIILQLEQYNLVNFVPLNIKDEDTISVVLQHVEHAMQYGEDEEPKEPNDEAELDWY